MRPGAERQPVVVVGVPVEGVAAVDARGRAAIAEATLLCGARRHLEEVPPHGEERLEVGDVDACVERLRRRRPEERAVVVATGDPLLYGIGATLVRALGRDEVSVIPATSSVQEAFARAGVPWENAVVLSAHGRPLGPVVAGVGAAPVAAILCGPDAPPHTVAAALLAGGVEDCRAVVAERLGGPVERVVDARLARVARGHFDPMSVLVLDRSRPPPPAAAAAPGGPPELPPFGRPETEFSHAGGMVTRAEVRAVVLAYLHPAAAAVVWDVGAGSGSIGIEAAALAPAARVFAVERDPAQLEHLRANVAAHAPEVVVVAGEAPEALGDLPDPDAVVVGGHGGRLAEILGTVRARLRPGGRLVCSLATLEGVLVARVALADWEPRIAQVTISRGVAAGRALRFRAEDPVVVVGARRPR